MNPLTFWLLVVLALVAGLLVGWMSGRVRLTLTAEQRDTAHALLEENQKVLEYWKTLCLEEKRKREEIFDVLSRIGKERDTWQAWFQKCGLEHSVAQAALISECERLSRKAGDKIRLRDGIKAATTAFEAKYGPAGYAKIAERIATGEGPDDVHRE